MFATNNSYLTPATTLSNPFPTGIQQPVGNSLGINTYLGQSITFNNPQMLNEYGMRWNFDVQQQLTNNTSLEVAYIGNHAVHLTTSYNFDSLPAKYLSTLAGSRYRHHQRARRYCRQSIFAGCFPARP